MRSMIWHSEGLAWGRLLTLYEWSSALVSRGQGQGDWNVHYSISCPPRCPTTPWYWT